MDERCDRADAAPEELRDLGVGQVFVEPQHEGGALAVLQLGDRVE